MERQQSRETRGRFWLDSSFREEHTAKGQCGNNNNKYNNGSSSRKKYRNREAICKAACKEKTVKEFGLQLITRRGRQSPSTPLRIIRTIR